MKSIGSKLALYLLVVLSGAGCASVQLKENTIAQGESLTDLQYEMVLDNVAMFEQARGSLPWHLNIVKGAITINDNVSSSFSYKWAPANRTLGVSASRFWQGDWTFAPVMDTNALTKLQQIYQSVADDVWKDDCGRVSPGWIKRGVSPPALGCHSGHYGSVFVWVEATNLDNLRQLTLQVLKAVGAVKKLSIGINDAQSFAQKLKENSDSISQYLNTQLPSGLKSLLSNYNTQAPPPLLFTNALSSALNQVVRNWTIDDATRLFVSMQLSASPVKLRQEVLRALAQQLKAQPQGADLVELIIQLLHAAYPAELSGLIESSEQGSPLQPGLFLSPGASRLISP